MSRRVVANWTENQRDVANRVVAHPPVVDPQKIDVSTKKENEEEETLWKNANLADSHVNFCLYSAKFQDKIQTKIFRLAQKTKTSNPTPNVYFKGHYGRPSNRMNFVLGESLNKLHTTYHK